MNSDTDPTEEERPNGTIGPNCGEENPDNDEDYLDYYWENLASRHRCERRHIAEHMKRFRELFDDSRGR